MIEEYSPVEPRSGRATLICVMSRATGGHPQMGAGRVSRLGVASAPSRLIGLDAHWHTSFWAQPGGLSILPSDERLPEVAHGCIAALGNELQMLKTQILQLNRRIRAWH